MPSASARSIAAIMMSAVGRAGAAEHPVGAERHAGRDALDASPLAPTMPATCVPWPSQSSGFGSGAGVGL